MFVVRKNTRIQTLLVQQVSHRQSVTYLHLAPLTRLVRRIATPMPAPVIFDLKRQIIYVFVL